MKFRLILFLFFIVVSNTLFSQDIIIKQAGDSIQCYITKVKRDSIYFRIKESSGIVSNRAISQKTVRSFEFNYYEASESLEEKKKEKSIYLDFAPGLGWSHRVGKLDPSFSKSDEKEYRNGIYFRGRLGLFIKKKVSTGLFYNFHKTDSRLPNLAGGVNSTVEISFWAPYISLQSKPINNNLSFLGTVALGKLTYKETVSSFSSFGVSKLTIDESTLGINLGASLLLLFSNLSNLSIDFNLISGKVEGDVIDNSGSTITSFTGESAATITVGFSFRVLF